MYESVLYLPLVSLYLVLGHRGRSGVQKSGHVGMGFGEEERGKRKWVCGYGA